MNKYIIYKYTSPSGKSYVGQTKNEKARIRQHRSSKDNTYFHKAINKHGFENFEYEILENNLTLEQANSLEKHYIDFYNTLSPNGYNLTTGGDNYVLSNESRKKISVANTGRKLSEDAKRKIGENSRNRSLETREKLRQASLGKKRTPESIRKGVHSRSWYVPTKEMKNKSSETQGTKIRVNGIRYSSMTIASTSNGHAKAYFGKIVSGVRGNPHNYKIELLVDSEWVDYRELQKENLLDG